jgi:hypothetical protein
MIFGRRLSEWFGHPPLSIAGQESLFDPKRSLGRKSYAGCGGYFGLAPPDAE